MCALRTGALAYALTTWMLPLGLETDSMQRLRCAVPLV